MGKVNNCLTKSSGIVLSMYGWTDTRYNGLHNFIVWLPVRFLLGAFRHCTKTKDARTLSRTAVEMVQDVICIIDAL